VQGVDGWNQIRTWMRTLQNCTGGHHSFDVCFNWKVLMPAWNLDDVNAKLYSVRFLTLEYYVFPGFNVLTQNWYCIQGVGAHAGAPSSPAALVDFLNSISGSHTVSGQFIEFGPLDPIVSIYNNTNQWLGLIGGDYWWYGETGWDATYSFNQIAANYASAGGLITLTTSMPNPTTGGPLYDVSNLNVNDLFTQGTDTNNNLMAMLTSIAQGLQQLQQAGVVVIWRPFHENDGNWFWWGTNFLSDSQFVSMWQMVWGFMQKSGINNVAWLYSCNAGATSLSRYPGGSYADIVGFDLYTSDPTQGQGTYQLLQTLGKPTVLAEFGPGGPNGGDTNFQEPSLISAIQSTMPNISFWQQWWDGNAGGVGWGMAECQNVSEALNDPWVLNRGDF